jgi:hypothetical protein
MPEPLQITFEVNSNARVPDGCAYQACRAPQCGQPTDVDTVASNTNPQQQE